MIREDEVPEVEAKIADIIVLSQCCDLVYNKIEIVLVCPYYPLKYFIENLPTNKRSSKGSKKALEHLRKDFLPGYHLLNKSTEAQPLSDYQVLGLKNVYGIQFVALKQIVQGFDERIRLLPPHREHLSQAFARYFMRVGLPQDIKVEGY